MWQAQACVHQKLKLTVSVVGSKMWRQQHHGFVHQWSGFSFIIKPSHGGMVYFLISPTLFIKCAISTSSCLFIPLLTALVCLSDDIDGVPQRWGTSSNRGTNHTWDDVSRCCRVLQRARRERLPSGWGLERQR